MVVTSGASAPRPAGPPSPPTSYADIVERLFAEFEHHYTLGDIVGMVHECRAQRSCSPAAALPELIERLARQRLSTRAPRHVRDERLVVP